MLKTAIQSVLTTLLEKKIAALKHRVPIVWLKQLKLNGWSTVMLVTAYRAYCFKLIAISLISFSVVMLTSVSAMAINEIIALNGRLLRIIGINESNATTFKILPINTFIEQICDRTLTRILSDSNHPITLSLPCYHRPNSRFSLYTNRAKKAAYRNSFLQKYLWKFRNDSHITKL